MTYFHNYYTPSTLQQHSLLLCSLSTRQNMMSLLHKHLVIIPLLILWFCSPSCYSSSQEDNTLNNILDEPSTYDNNQAYPTYYGFIEEERDSELDAELSGLIEYGQGRYDSDRASSPECPPAVFTVDDFDAKGDGVSDDTDAFEEAWNKACSSSGSTLVIPENKIYLLKPIRFSGPCKENITVQIYGTIEASDNRADYKKDRRHWLVFDDIQNLVVEGGGTIDGKGEIWWNNSCKINKTQPCTHAPTALTFYDCNNLRVENLEIKNAQQVHLSFQKCINVEAINLMVTAPGKSPNTDGIHVTNTQNIDISSCIIKTGDDCISIVDGARNVQAMDITCGPGHGISIGSLGAHKSQDHVSDIKVDRARLVGTTNGVRIKTWQGGSGSASNIIFQNITMEKVKNPIIIDQNYCDQDDPCKTQSSAVQVKNVVYRNIRGTSASDVAIDFDCSKKYPCKGIVLDNIDITGEGDEEVKASCKNVKWNKVGKVTPSC